MAVGTVDWEVVRRDIVQKGWNRRTYSEQEPKGNPVVPASPHLWGHGSGRKSPWCKKRTSAPQFQTQNSFAALKGVVLRSRGSWPTAPLTTRRGEPLKTNVKGDLPAKESHEYRLPEEELDNDKAEAEKSEAEKSGPQLLISLQSQLHDIEEIEEEQNGDDTSSSSTLFSKTSSIRKDHRGSEDSRQFQSSPSPTCSISNIHLIKSRRKKKISSRSVTSTSSDTSGAASTVVSTCAVGGGGSASGKMQAEQGSIKELKSYQTNRYLRNRRHTLANVRQSTPSHMIDFYHCHSMVPAFGHEFKHSKTKTLRPVDSLCL
ncbi:hypothetical protein RUM44_000024 [Polyplax serrata]|uniref:Uncharacterized protein n=1 Tax=Polyplax serrata TaxID=468196 RepID=A0ABR1B496_POLSC